MMSPQWWQHMLGFWHWSSVNEANRPSERLKERTAESNPGNQQEGSKVTNLTHKDTGGPPRTAEERAMEAAQWGTDETTVQ